MGNLLIVPPTPIVGIAVSRGTGGTNLLSIDPKEVWRDTAVGAAVTISLDFGGPVPIDTVFLGCVASAAADATWSISGGIAGYAEQAILAASALRVPDRYGRFAAVTHAFWHGNSAYVRYLRITLTQPEGAPISIGALVAGASFMPQYNQEWGSGRSVRDTGVITRLASGGVSVVEGARFGTYKWTLGDLNEIEADELYELQLDVGETRQILVVEDPERSAGMRNRLHYGVLTGLRPYERRNARQIRWEFTMDDLVTQTASAPLSDALILTLNGQPLTLGGDILTIGNNG